MQINKKAQQQGLQCKLVFQTSQVAYEIMDYSPHSVLPLPYCMQCIQVRYFMETIVPYTYLTDTQGSA